MERVQGPYLSAVTPWSVFGGQQPAWQDSIRSPLPEVGDSRSHQQVRTSRRQARHFRARCEHMFVSPTEQPGLGARSLATRGHGASHTRDTGCRVHHSAHGPYAYNPCRIHLAANLEPRHVSHVYTAAGIEEIDRERQSRSSRLAMAARSQCPITHALACARMPPVPKRHAEFPGRPSERAHVCDCIVPCYRSRLEASERGPRLRYLDRVRDAGPRFDPVLHRLHCFRARQRQKTHGRAQSVS